MGCVDPRGADDPAASPQLIYRLLPELADPGSEAFAQGHLPLRQFSKGALIYRLPEGVDYDLTLTNTGSGVLLEGTARATVWTECTRCLDEASLPLQAAVEAYYILRPRDAELAAADDSAVLVGPDGKVDLAEPILAGLIYELPLIVLCRPDCAGLCAQCGTNLNHESCNCRQPTVNLDNHPLAALRELLPETVADGGNAASTSQDAG
ncbi:MAG: YceD family protein [Actinomycetia bacterium]|nr:YceD family protein [Actinomycetes bacterium]